MNLFERAKKIATASDYVIKFGKYENTRLSEIYQLHKEYFEFLETIEDDIQLTTEIKKMKIKFP